MLYAYNPHSSIDDSFMIVVFVNLSVVGFSEQVRGHVCLCTFFRCCDNLQRENNKLHKVMPAFFGVWSSPLYRFLIDIFILTTSADGMLRNYKSILTTPI